MAEEPIELGARDDLLFDERTPTLPDRLGDVFALQGDIVAVVRNHLAADQDMDPFPLLRLGRQALALVHVLVEPRVLRDQRQDVVRQPAQTGVRLAAGGQRLHTELPADKSEPDDIHGNADGADDGITGHTSWYSALDGGRRS